MADDVMPDDVRRIRSIKLAVFFENALQSALDSRHRVHID